MHKQDLVNEVAEQAGITKTNASTVIDAITQSIQDSLAKGEPVAMVGFGTFKVAHRKATTGRNPRTGDPIDIPATTLPTFSAGKNLKESVNQK